MAHKWEPASDHTHTGAAVGGWHERYSCSARNENHAQLHFSIRLDGRRVVGFTFLAAPGGWTWRIEWYSLRVGDPPPAVLRPAADAVPCSDKHAAFERLEEAWTAIIRGDDPATLGQYEVGG